MGSDDLTYGRLFLPPSDWHQYDDIICMRPPGKFQRLVDYFTDGTKRDVVRGKKIAATIMLDGIFGVLQTWSLINLKSFFTQFEQFYAAVRVPMIYEGRARPWSSLQYKEGEVPSSCGPPAPVSSCFLPDSQHPLF